MLEKFSRNPGTAAVHVTLCVFMLSAAAPFLFMVLALLLPGWFVYYALMLPWGISIIPGEFIAGALSLKPSPLLPILLSAISSVVWGAIAFVALTLVKHNAEQKT